MLVDGIYEGLDSNKGGKIVYIFSGPITIEFSTQYSKRNCAQRGGGRGVGGRRLCPINKGKPTKPQTAKKKKKLYLLIPQATSRVLFHFPRNNPRDNRPHILDPLPPPLLALSAVRVFQRADPSCVSIESRGGEQRTYRYFLQSRPSSPHTPARLSSSSVSSRRVIRGGKQTWSVKRHSSLLPCARWSSGKERSRGETVKVPFARTG